MWLGPSISKLGVKPLMLLELVLTLILGGPHKVYYLLALRFATSSTLPQPNPSSNSLAPKSLAAPTFEPSTKKEKQTLALVVKLESKEVEEVEKLKKKKKGKEKNVIT